MGSRCAPLLLVGIVLLFAGCSSDDDALSGPPGEGLATIPVTRAPVDAETALLTDVRAARHDGFDRVVFEFRNTLPGYDVRYVGRPVLADGSGAEVEVRGTAVVQVRMENALDADLSVEQAPPTYTGPRRISPGLATVVELARTGGFEAVLTWVVGLDRRAAFRVTTLRDPPRLVVDFAPAT